MKNWTYGVNSLYKTGSIFLEEAPWYVFAIDQAVEWSCDFMPAIPLPDIAIKDEEGNDTTLKEHYGDLSQWWHCKVHDPVFQWVEKQKQLTVVESSYEKVKTLFYESDPKFFDDHEKKTKKTSLRNKNRKD